MKICFAVSECVPYVKTGGLADVAGALPKALQQLGCEVKVFLPLYSSIDTVDHDLILAAELADIPVKIGDKMVTFNTWYGHLPNSEVEVYLLDCPLYYDRDRPYTSDSDEDERFVLLQQGILQILQRYHWAPDVMHCNDWQTALLPVYLKINYKWDSLFANTATLLSIHNIGYQGRFSRDAVYRAGLSLNDYYPGGPLEFDNSFCFLKAGILFSEIVATVSETYAHEIQTHEYGAGLDGVLASRKNDLLGILNGIDTEEWNPKTDRYLRYPYSEKNLDKKLQNKKALLQQMKLPFDESVATIGMISRLTPQKGFELLPPVIDELMKLPLQIVVLGSGEPAHEEFLRAAATTYRDQFSTYVGYNNELAHLITGGADMFLMPSRYEPCGLNQMFSLNYGTVPIVRKTGGLADTVKDYHEYYQRGNGFSFSNFSGEALYLTVRRALDLFRDKKIWRSMMRRGMREDFSWSASAKRYIELYEKAKERHVLP